MANRGDVISVDKLWDIFDREREKAWEGVDAPTSAMMDRTSLSKNARNVLSAALISSGTIPHRTRR